MIIDLFLILKGDDCSFFPFSDSPCLLEGLSIERCPPSLVASALEARKNIRVDPFKKGFEFPADRFQLGAVRLCFQVEYFN